MPDKFLDGTVKEARRRGVPIEEQIVAWARGSEPRPCQGY
jgi:hypothetical protein